jgi:hypothetical protein
MRQVIAGSVMVGALLLAGGAQAQETTLGESVKKACHKELTTFCKGVPAGQARILACLYAFEDKVSDQCVTAVYDAADQLEQAAAAIKTAAAQCKGDLQKFCAEVKPGAGKGLACLRKNEKDVSQPCKDAVKQTGLVK